MKIEFKSHKLKKSVESPKAILKHYGANAKKVNQRLEELKSAPTLSELRNIPAAYCHELKQNRKGQFAVSVSGNHRIIFEPDHHPVPVKEDGGWDWTGITAIRIVEIGEDYH